MRSPLALLRFFAKAALNAVGGGVAGDFVVEVLPDMARDVWNWWGKDRPEQELRAEVQQIAQLTPAEAEQQAAQVVREEAGSAAEPVLKLVTALVARVPATIRASQRSIADPSGRTVSPSLRLRQANDLIPLLPHRVPRFQEGQKPLPGLDWQLVEPLGVGGFGEVWRARNPHMGTDTALKFCLDPVAARSLRNEVDLLRRVQAEEGRHPGIVQLRNTYLSADPPFVEYEYIAGGDLASIIGEWQALPAGERVERAAQLMYELAGIVGFAHSLRPRAIIHRDLKPANVLVQPTSEGKSKLKVADFGIGGVSAEHAIAGITRRNSRGVFLTEVLRGSYTPIYASPEQQRGLDPDPRDDVFSLGMIWLHLLTGDLMLQPIGNWGRAISELNLPGPMLELLNKCLEAQAKWRLENAAVLEQELRKLLGVKEQKPKRSRFSWEPGDVSVTPSPGRTPPPPARTNEVVNSIGMRFVLIPPGKFLMGSPDSEEGRNENESPLYEVEITRPFYLGVDPVTVGQFLAFVEKSGYRTHAETEGGSYRWTGEKWKKEKNLNWASPGWSLNSQDPVTYTNWHDTISFLKWLSDLAEENTVGQAYRLPTEAEWEYACRGVSPSRSVYPFGNAISDKLANFNNHLQRTSAVGSYPANGFCLHDMIGNVWECCSDWYDANYYQQSPKLDPRGPTSGTSRVARGGAWSDDATYCRSAYRDADDPSDRSNLIGFRVVLVPA